MKDRRTLRCLMRGRLMAIATAIAIVVGVSLLLTLYLNMQLQGATDAANAPRLFPQHRLAVDKLGGGRMEEWEINREKEAKEEEDEEEEDYVDTFEDLLVKETDIFDRTDRAVCKERTNFVFIKTMKCATQTVVQVLRRFGYLRHLNFVLPHKTNIYLGWPYFIEDIDYRPSKKMFNALVEHSIYNRTVMSALMPRDTAYLTIIREPFSHFKSSFHYFNVANISRVPGPDHVTKYLHNIHKFEAIYKSAEAARTRYCIPDGFSITKNLLSHCLGMPLGFPSGRPNITLDEHAVHQYISSLEKECHLVMIMEYFHESLVLLKRLMCWSLKDIVYHSSNVGNYSYKHTMPNQRENEEIYRKWSHVDYLLYNRFNRTFWQKVHEQGRTFKKEVAQFNSIQDQVTQFCSDIKSGEATLEVLPSAFNEKFTVTANFCYSLSVDMLALLRTRFDRTEDVEEGKDDQVPKRGC